MALTSNLWVKEQLCLSIDDCVDEYVEIYKGEIKSKAATPVQGTLFEEDSGNLAAPIDKKGQTNVITLRPNYYTYPKG